MFFVFVGGQRTGNAVAHIMNIGFRAFGVFFDQYFTGDFLFGQRRHFGSVCDCGKGKLL